MLTGSADQSIKIWDLAKGNNLRVLSGHTHEVTALAITRDGNVVVSGSTDGTIRLWDLWTGTLLRVLTTQAGRVTGMALIPGGRLISTAYHCITIWDFEGEQEPFELGPLRGSPLSLAITPDGRFALTGMDTSLMQVCDLNAMPESGVLLGHSAEVTALAITADGSQACSGSADGTVQCWSSWEWNTPKSKSEIDLEISYRQSGRIPPWAPIKVPQVFKGHCAVVTAVAVFPDRELGISGAIDGGLIVWDLTAWSKVVEEPESHNGPISALALTPKGTRIISGSEDKMIKVWKVSTYPDTRTFRGHDRRVTTLAVMPNGRYLVSGSRDRTIKIWEFGTGLAAQTLESHAEGVTSVAVTSDSKCVISAGLIDGGRGDIKIWRSSDWSLIKVSEPCPKTQFLVAVDKGNHALSASDSRIVLWDLKDRLEIIREWKFDSSIRSSAVAGGKVLLALADHSLRLWDWKTSTELAVITGQGREVSAVAISANGSYGVSATVDRTVNLWDLAGKQVLASFTGDAPFHACAFTPDKKMIVAGDALGRLHFLRPERCRL